MSRKFQGILCICALLVCFAVPVTFADDAKSAPTVIDIILEVIGDLFPGESADTDTDDDDEFGGSIVPGG